MAVGNQQRREAPQTGLYGAQPVKDAPQGHAYDFVNCDALAERLTNDGNDVVSPSGARYKAICLGGSSRSMTLAALRRIAALAEGGATIVGMKPAGSPSLADDHAVYASLADRLWPGSASTAVGKGRVIASFQQGRGAPASIVMPALTPLDQSRDPGVKYFSGIAAYTKTFNAPRGWAPGRPLTLDLGAAREVAEVRVNGALAGYAWPAPYTVEIGPFVKPGKNELEIRVANLWVNRLIRDADPAVKDKVTWTDQPTYRPDAPLRPSGLIGPVTLQGSRD